VEKEFHLEINTGQGEERTGASQRRSGRSEPQQQSELYTLHKLVRVHMYMGYSAGKHVCTHGTMRIGVYRSEK
jgi:hypothetical protein